jgi:hypothetical protein
MAPRNVQVIPSGEVAELNAELETAQNKDPFHAIETHPTAAGNVR